MTTCEFCLQDFPSLSHKKRHKKIRHYYCVHCDTQFENADHIKKHPCAANKESSIEESLLLLPPSTSVSVLSKSSSASASALSSSSQNTKNNHNNHRRKKIGPKCPNCDREFCSNYSLKRHISNRCCYSSNQLSSKSSKNKNNLNYNSDSFKMINKLYKTYENRKKLKNNIHNDDNNDIEDDVDDDVNGDNNSSEEMIL